MDVHEKIKEQVKIIIDNIISTPVRKWNRDNIGMIISVRIHRLYKTCRDLEVPFELIITRYKLNPQTPTILELIQNLPMSDMKSFLIMTIESYGIVPGIPPQQAMLPVFNMDNMDVYNINDDDRLIQEINEQNIINSINNSINPKLNKGGTIKKIKKIKKYSKKNKKYSKKIKNILKK